MHPADSGTLFGVLADVARYPDWWPQVRSVRQVDESTAWVVCRSLLPYRLVLRLTRSVEDPDRGVLEVDIDGALRGRARWTLTGHGAGTHVGYEQEVRTATLVLTAGSRLLRPVLVANHAWMMRGGRRGLLRRCPAPAGGSGR